MRVGEIAAEHPLATRVFARHGIDYCCGGGTSIKQACTRRGLDTEVILSEIEAEVERSPVSGPSWREATRSDLVAHIVATYHVPLREELPRLDAMARKVSTVHSDRDHDGRLAAIAATFDALRADLEGHMLREEQELFPALVAQKATGVEPFEHDHEEAGRALATLRRLTDDFEPPAEACTTWRALYAGLEAFESTMHEHVHLENNVLFHKEEPVCTGDPA
jgi:regulator of cell morphogenesis and NO signaling